MPSYAVAGVVLDADLPLAGLAPTAADQATWVIRRAAVAPDLQVELVSEMQLADGTPWRELRAGADGYQLTYYGRVSFYVDVATSTVTYVPEGDLPEVTLRHLLVDQLLPHLLALDGALVLHASAVVHDGRAIAFVGPTGAGKSSLAAGFVRRGATLRSDDFVVLQDDGDSYLATPAYPSLRLWGDAVEQFAGGSEDLHDVADYTAKRRWEVPSEAFAVEPVPLRAFVAPGNDPGANGPPMRIGRLRGSDAFVVLYQELFRVEGPGRRARQEADLDRLLRLAERVPVLMIEHRRDYALLDDALDAVLGALPDD